MQAEEKAWHDEPKKGHLPIYDRSGQRLADVLMAKETAAVRTDDYLVIWKVGDRSQQ